MFTRAARRAALMGHLIAWIYERTRRARWVWPLLLAMPVGLALWSVSRARYGQDLFDALPREPELERYGALLRSTGQGRVIAGFSGEGVSLDSLSASADRFTEAVLRDRVDLVSGAFTRPDPAVFEQAAAAINARLPLYADPQVLGRVARMDSLAVDSSIGAVRDRLASFSGELDLESTLADPFGLAAPLMDRVMASGRMAGVTLLNGQLFTPDSSTAIVVITLRGEDHRVLDTLNAAMARAAAPGVSGAVFGAVPMAAVNARRITADASSTSLIALVLIVAILIWRYRSWRVPLLFTLPPAVGFVLGWGALAWARPVVSSLSLGAGAALLGIAFDYCFHFFTHLRHRRDVAATLREIAAPMLLGCATTVLAFAALSFTGSRILADLGIVAVFMLTGAALTVLLVLPHFIAVPPAVEEATLPSGQPKKRILWGLVLVAVITAVLVPFASRVEYDGDPEHMSWIPDDMRALRDELEGEKDRLVPVLLEGHANTEDGARRMLEQAGDRARATGLDTLMPLLPTDLRPSEMGTTERLARWNSAFGGENGARFQRWVQGAAAHHGFVPGAFASFSDQLGQARPAGVDTAITALAGEVLARTGSEVAVAGRLMLPPGRIPDLEEALAGEPGTGVLHRHKLGQRLQRLVGDDLAGILWRTSLIVFLALLITYGRIELALITFIPMALGWVWILGLCGLFGIHFNAVNILVCTFVFGLGDDYCIFTSEGLLARFRTGADNTRSFRDAVVLSAITTIIGTGALVFAQHPALRSIAFLSVAGMGALLVISLTLQPALFHLLIGGRAEKGKQPFTLASLGISLFAFLYFLAGCLLLSALWMFFLLLPVPKHMKQHWTRCAVRLFTGSLVYVMVNVRKDIQGFRAVVKDRPAIVIANHASFIDILAMLMITPKAVMVTNRWVWNSPFFGRVVRYAGFLCTDEGHEVNVEKARGLMAQGLSIIVFPEGTRSKDGTIGRFHKGAFQLAEALNAPIVPVVLHGFGEAMGKSDALLKNTTISMRTLSPIMPDDPRFGRGYRERTKAISKWFKEEYERIRAARETPRWFHERLVRNFTYKGPVIEWYTRVKARMDTALHELLHARIARDATVADLGAGHGMVGRLLHWSAPGRRVLAFERDEEKVLMARHCYSRDAGISFNQADLSDLEPPPADAYVIKDVLHYLEPMEQRALLLACARRMRPGGAIFVRDGFAEPGARHERTRRTERLSTGIGFNKTKGELRFMTRDTLLAIAAEAGLRTEWALAEARTSNQLAILSATDE